MRDFPASLTTPGASYSSAAFDLFASLPWWTLRPSGTDPGFAGSTLVTSGQGAWGGDDYITSALTDDRHWLLAYVPVTGHGHRTFDVDLGAMAGPVRARWFDPAGGTYLTASDGYEFAAERERSFTTPGLRSDGTDDWLLVLDSAGSPRCGTVTESGLYTAPDNTPSGVACQVTATLESDPSVVACTTVAVRSSSTAPHASEVLPCSPTS
jgi:hypothetical protein